jgi:hypothetical protein
MNEIDIALEICHPIVQLWNRTMNIDEKISPIEDFEKTFFSCCDFMPYSDGIVYQGILYQDQN